MNAIFFWTVSLLLCDIECYCHHSFNRKVNNNVKNFAARQEKVLPMSNSLDTRNRIPSGRAWDDTNNYFAPTNSENIDYQSKMNLEKEAILNFGGDQWIPDNNSPRNQISGVESPYTRRRQTIPTSVDTDQLLNMAVDDQIGRYSYQTNQNGKFSDSTNQIPTLRYARPDMEYLESNRFVNTMPMRNNPSIYRSNHPAIQNSQQLINNRPFADDLDDLTEEKFGTFEDALENSEDSLDLLPTLSESATELTSSHNTPKSSDEAANILSKLLGLNVGKSKQSLEKFKSISDTSNSEPSMEWRFQKGQSATSPVIVMPMLIPWAPPGGEKQPHITIINKNINKNNFADLKHTYNDTPGKKSYKKRKKGKVKKKSHKNLHKKTTKYTKSKE